MDFNYYIQTGSNAAVNIFSNFGILVKKTEGLSNFSDLKKISSDSYDNAQGDTVYVPNKTVFDQNKASITFAMINKSKDVMYDFVKYITDVDQFSYYDTFKSIGFRGYLDKFTLVSEIYRDGYSYVEFKCDFNIPHGLVYVFDNTGGFGIFVDIIEGSCDLYYSDGRSFNNITEDYADNLNGFIIFCPSHIDGTLITQRENKVLGVTSKIIGINLTANPRVNPHNSARK